MIKQKDEKDKMDTHNAVLQPAYKLCLGGTSL